MLSNLLSSHLILESFRYFGVRQLQDGLDSPYNLNKKWYVRVQGLGFRV